MTTTALPTHRREPVFPTRLFIEQAQFAVLVWVMFSLFVIVLTFGVSLVREIEVSGWNVAGQPARWFGFVIGIYLGWSLLQLHVTHGGTRRGYMIQMAGFVLAYALLLGALFSLTFFAEAGVYALAGWPQALHEPQLYQSALDMPMVAVQWVLIFGVWIAGGLYIGASWYRSNGLGTIAIVVGLLVALASTYSISGDAGPLNWVHHLLAGASRPGALVTIVLHMVIIAGLMGGAWLTVRTVAIRSKSADA